MNYYFAPLEGLTDSIYRRLHHKYFPGVDRYYTPFFSPTIHRSLTPREERELPMADAAGFEVIPQLLTKNPEDFLWMSEVCMDRGYREVNLNLGCPSGTVVSKGKGSGMLADPDGLQRFLDAVYAHAPLPVSVKTRIGINAPEECPRIMEILNQYPIAELTIHPRIRKDFYNKPVHMDWFDFCVRNSSNPVCYNGDLCSMDEIETFHSKFPEIGAVMIGRGLIGDPGMLTPNGTTAEKLEGFYDELLERYLTAFGGSRNAMFRLKENWRYLLCRFEASDKLGKRLRKATDLSEYRALTHAIFHTLELKPVLEPDWR